MTAKRILLLALVFAFAPALYSQTVVGTITREGMVPSAVSVFETGNKVFVADETTGYVYIYDGTTLDELGSVNVGGPVGRMVVDEAYGKLYATVGTTLANAKVVAVNAATNALIGDVVTCSPFCANLIQLAHDPGLAKVYAVSLFSLVQVDVATDTTASVTLDSASYAAGSLAVNPVTHEVFIGPTTYNVNLQVVNGSTLAKSTAPVVGSFFGMGINWIENKVYRADASGGPYTVLDRDTNSVSDVGCNNDATVFTFNPASNQMYTDSEIDGFASIIEGSNDSCFNLGLRGFTMGFRLSTNHLYYAGETDIAVLDATTQVVEIIPINNPSPSSLVLDDVAVNQTTGRVFIINDGNALDFVTVLQDTPMLTRPPIYVGAPGSRDILTIDPLSKTATDSWSLYYPLVSHGMAIRPGGGRLYTGEYEPSSGYDPTQFDAFAGVGSHARLGSIPSGGGDPNVPVVSPDDSRVYITNSASANVGVIDVATSSVVTTVPVGTTPWGAAITPNGSKVYVANRGGPSGSISVIDTGSNTVSGTIPVGLAPWGVAVNPAGTKVYVANSGSNSVSVIDTATDTVIGTVYVGATPHWLAVAPDGGRVYVSNNGSGTVSVIETGTDTVIQTVTVGSTPEGVAVRPDGSEVYVVNSVISAASSLSVISPSDYSVATVALPSWSHQSIPVAVTDPTSKFAGRVTGPRGTVEGALVRALQSAEEKGTATTDAAGDYSIFNLLSGTYDIEVSASGCTPLTLSGQSVAVGRTSVLNPAFTALECPLPEVALSPPSLAFGAQALAISSQEQSVTLTNTGGADLFITSVAKVGGNAGDFAFSHNCPLSPNTVAANGFCNIDVTFTPTAPGPRKSALMISSDAPGSPHRVMLTGQGSALGFSPDGLTFPSQQAGTTSDPQNVTVHNYDSASVAVWSSAIGGDDPTEFTRTSSCPVPPATLAASGSCTLAVRFSPTSAGAKTAALLISHDGGASPSLVGLAGTATSALLAERYAAPFAAASEVQPSIAAEDSGAEPSAHSQAGPDPNGVLVLEMPPFSSAPQDRISFGSVPVGQRSAPYAVEVKNPTSQRLAITRLAIAGPGRQDFEFTSHCPKSLGPYETCTVELIFAPQSSGQRSAQFAVDYGADEQRHIDLLGSGQATGAQSAQ
jgi:YVTN family beta-propeller protein